MNSKFISQSTVFLFLTLMSLTHAFATTSRLPGGGYIGASVGYDSYWMRQNISLPAPDVIGGNPRINAPGWVGGALLGYGKYFNDFWYLGMEMIGNFSQANESYIISSNSPHFRVYSTHFEAKNSWGMVILPGLRINPMVTAYIRWGLYWARFRSKEIAGSRVMSEGTVTGPNYGLGVEMLLAHHLSLRAEYTHTNNDSYSSILGTNFDPSDNQMMLSLIWHFWK